MSSSTTSDVRLKQPDDFNLTSDTLKREKGLKTLVQSTQQRVGDLSEYLKQREDELKRRNDVVANLYKEFEDLKQQADKENVMKDNICGRLFIQYDNIKKELDEENVVLQMIVEQVREDLLNLQKEHLIQGKSHMYSQKNVNELKMIREKSTLSHEKYEIKSSVENSERERLMLQRYINSVETSNKDLEDQLLYLTSENYKAKHDFAREESLEEYNTMIQELEKVENLNISEEDELAFKDHLKMVRIDTLNVKESKTSPFDSQLLVKDGLSEKSKILLSGYETLLTKLLQQRREIISKLGLDKTGQFRNISSNMNSSQNIEYKLASEIENNIREKCYEVDSSFTAFEHFLQSSDDDWKRIEYCYRELSYFLEKSRQPR